MPNFRILHALKIPFHGFGIDLTTIMEEHPFAQSEGISEQVWRDVPLCGNTRHRLRLGIEVEEALSSRGEWVGHEVHNIAVRVETGSVTTRGKAQGPTTLRMALARLGLANESEGRRASECTACGCQEGTPGKRWVCVYRDSGHLLTSLRID